MATIDISSQTYNYTLLRQQRRTVQIELTAANTLVIKAPLQVPLADLSRLLQRKAAWLAKKSALFAPAPFTLEDGCFLPYKGRSFMLQIMSSQKKPTIHITGSQILANLYTEQGPEHLPSLLLTWYRQQAMQELRQRTLFWSGKIGAPVRKITLKDQKTRWGSCSSLGNINYNWRIIMAPEEVMDYLVIHEVSHRRFLNHSPAFWQLVAAHAPRFNEHKQWLRQNGTYLFSVL